MFTRQIRQSLNFEVGNGKNYQCPKKSFWFLSRSFRREPWHCSADIKGPLSANLPELPIRNSEEFEVGNGKNYLHPKKSPVFFSRSVNILVRMVSSVMYIFCNAAFPSVTLSQFLLRIATGPEFGDASHYRKKRFGEVIMFCNALHYRINCLGNWICNALRPDGILGYVSSYEKCSDVFQNCWIVVYEQTTSWHRIVRFGCDPDADSNSAMQTARTNVKNTNLAKQRSVFCSPLLS